MQRLLLWACLLCAGSSVAQTAIYRWVDADGVTHFADSLANVPAGARVETTTGDEVWQVSAPAPAGTSGAVEKPAAAPVKVAVVAKPSEEDRWRKLFSDARERVASLEDELAVDKEAIGGLGPVLQCGYGAGVAMRTRGGVLLSQGGCVPVANPEYVRRQDRITLNEKALARAKEKLADLERLAANESVPLEWRR